MHRLWTKRTLNPYSSFCLSLFLKHSPSLTHFLIQFRMSNFDAQTLNQTKLSIILFLSHTHIHPHTHLLPHFRMSYFDAQTLNQTYSQSIFLFVSLSLSLAHTNTHIHPLTHLLTYFRRGLPWEERERTFLQSEETEEATKPEFWET
mgnify:CR=1 FL=1